DGAEVEEEAAAVFEGGRLERAVVDELVFGADGFHDAREGGFDREGDEDLAVPFFWPARGPPHGRGPPHEGVVPEAVEVGPVVADHLGPGVFGVDVGGRDILGPAGHEGAGGGFPVSGGGWRGPEKAEY